LFRTGWLAAGGLLGIRSGSAARLEIGPNIYQSIGVRPLINCKGTFTIVSGSLTLPEVKRAMEEASRHYIHLDELMDAVGKRLAELTGAEFGIVTAGCAAALAHATAACIAGADPEKLQRLPDLTGLKNEVIIPGYSRNVYDHAVRMLGVKIIEVENLDELERACTARTGMIMVLGCPEDTGPFGLEPIAQSARKRGVPVLVDAAAEHLAVPNVHLKRGAHMVAYSGGKCLRGPQCAGILLGQKDLLKAAWLHSAPHHAFGRPMKVGKEEIMGMLAAVEMWMKRDHDAEWRTWQSWLDHIARRVTAIGGVTTEVLQPDGLSNRAPQLRIIWDGARLGIYGKEAQEILYNEDPRIVLGGATGDARAEGPSTITIMPYMMTPGDEKIAAERIHSVLSRPPKIARAKPPADPPANVAGQWDVRLEFLLGTAAHTLVLEQQENSLTGTHRGDVLAGDIAGAVEGNEIRFHSSHRYEGTRIRYEFAGIVRDGVMEGTAGLEEYGQARWTAERHKYAEPGGPVRPIKNKTL
jgi:L-seryl-tRNA(Ser) seleniumtransferase